MPSRDFKQVTRQPKPNQNKTQRLDAARERTAKSETRRLEGLAAAAAYEAARRAVGANAERLRGLRLARDAALAEAARAKTKRRPRSM
jgi:hypothetical protein